MMIEPQLPFTPRRPRKRAPILAAPAVAIAVSPTAVFPSLTSHGGGGGGGGTGDPAFLVPLALGLALGE
jgi:hypothetical protein